MEVTTYFPPDRGIESPYVNGLCNFLKGRGHSVRVLTKSWGTKLDSEFIRQLKVPSGEIPGYLSWAIQSWIPLSCGDQDLFHGHSLEGHLSCSLAAPWMPNVLHIHNSLIREPTFYDGWRHRLGFQIASFAVRRADVVITPTETVRRDLIASVKKADPTKIRAIPNFIDSSKFRPNVDGSKIRDKYNLKDKLLLLYFGRIKASKGITEICEAYEMIKDKGPFALMIAGSPRESDGYYQGLRKEHPDVIFTGRVEDPVPYYNAADVFCIYTLGYQGGETFAIALAEAMSSGKPSICSDIAVFREVAGDAARYVSPGDSSALAVEMLKLLRDGRMMRELGERGRQIAESKYDVTHVGERVEAAYEDAVHGKTNPIRVN